MPRTTTRREMLQLANKYVAKENAKKKKPILIAGWYISEKLDGGRCLWDGGITRGVPTDSVPWAGIRNPDTGLRKTNIKPVATGLWSRYGNPINAPDWYLNSLPCCPLDGELWAGRTNFQLAMSIIKDHVPNQNDWKKIKYAVYSSPPLASLFQTGEIKNQNMWCDIDREVCERFVLERMEKFQGDYKSADPGCTFEEELHFLQAYLSAPSDVCFMHRQVRLPMEEEAAMAAADSFVQGVLDKGGEGGMLRNGKATWTPKRHNDLLKFKPFDDDEATVVGFVAGEEGKQGNCLGKIGALVVKYGDIEFKIGGGLKMAEREFAADWKSTYATENPGSRMAADTQGKSFKVGQKITFKYRELSDDGVPKEARYWRKRDDE